MAEKKGLSKTKQKVNELVKQARESLKILRTLEKETVARAKSYVKLPDFGTRRRMTNERILSSLRKMGVATSSEISALDHKIQRIEALLSTKTPSRSTKAKRAAHES